LPQFEKRKFDHFVEKSSALAKKRIIRLVFLITTAADMK